MRPKFVKIGPKVDQNSVWIEPKCDQNRAEIGQKNVLCIRIMNSFSRKLNASNWIQNPLGPI